MKKRRGKMDGHTLGVLLRMFGMTEAERNRVIMDTGYDFAAGFPEGGKMRREKLYWDVFISFFEDDDRMLIGSAEPVEECDYRSLKRDLVNVEGFRAAFCRRYYGLKRPAQAKRQADEMDRWRKRLIASIGGWMRLSGKEGGIEAIKAVACRAAGKGDFNAIPKGQLVSLYNAFLQKQKDVKNVNTITQ